MRTLIAILTALMLFAALTALISNYDGTRLGDDTEEEQDPDDMGFD